MPSLPVSRAVLCLKRAVHGISVAAALYACGGSVASSGSGSAADASTPSADGCTSTATCPSAPDASPADASAGSDASAPADGGVCVDLGPAGFDTTCTRDADCMMVTFGTFCSDTAWCMCGGSVMNVDGKARYDAALQDLRARVTPGPGGCFCPFLGTPRCAVGQCTLCGGPANPNGQPDCHDAG